jgi:peptidyl-prolyl cis-trans isomerase B (cyclophilin B)
MRKILLLLIIITTLAFIGCNKSNQDPLDEVTIFTPDIQNDVLDHPKAIISTSFGEIKIILYPEIAPNTVNNFISLANSKFYDNLIFHRVIKGFMIQGGDPLGIGTGDPGYSIVGEFSLNGYNNGLSHEKGVISMARSQEYNSAGSQFFIMHEDYKSLDGQYSAFGKIFEGQDVVDSIANVDTDANDMPLENVTINSIEIDLNGYEYKEPDKIK